MIRLDDCICWCHVKDDRPRAATNDGLAICLPCFDRAHYLRKRDGSAWNAENHGILGESANSPKIRKIVAVRKHAPS